MEIPEVKQLIDTYHTAGKSREDTVAIVSAIPINGDNSEAFEYIDLKYKTTPDTELTKFNLTDAGNAEYFISLYGTTLRYDHSRGRWLRWDKHYWKPDTDKGITRLAVRSTRERYKAAVGITDLDMREKVAKWTISSEQKARAEALLSFAKDFRPITDPGTDWDTNGWLFCVENGVIDLKTIELRLGKQEDMITMKSPVTYDKEATCPLWLKFMDQITGGDEELKTYLQCAAGYSMTDEMKNQLWFFLYGLGSNGKTTFTMTLRRLMGDYGIRLDSDDLMIKDKKSRGSSPKEGVADTRGKRYAIASEIQDGKWLDIGLVKDMTGGDTIKARRLYEHEVEFLPTHKLWMFGNHKPVIKDTTNAAWRRLKLIPFAFTVPDNEIDLDLQSKLDAELPGILNWALEGCLQWQREGFAEPHLVTDAVAAYRHESDVLSDFFEDCCILEHLATITKSQLKEIRENWCKDNGQDPISQKAFRARLFEKGITEGRSSDHKTRIWRGIRLRTEDDIMDISDKTNGDFVANRTRDTEKSESPPMKGENETLIGKRQSSVRNVRNVQNVRNNDTPDYPTKKCQCGSVDFVLTDNKWVCEKCQTEAVAND